MPEQQVPDAAKMAAADALMVWYKQRYGRTPRRETVESLRDCVLDAVAPYVWIVGDKGSLRRD